MVTPVRVGIALLMGLLLSCTSGTVTTGTLSITGAWSGNFLSDPLTTEDEVLNPTGQPRISATVTLSLTQQEDGTLVGVATISDPETSCFSGGPIAGEVSGANYAFEISDGTGVTVSVSGSATQNTMRGVYSATLLTGICPAHSGSADFDRG